LWEGGSEFPIRNFEVDSVTSLHGKLDVRQRIVEWRSERGEFGNSVRRGDERCHKNVEKVIQFMIASWWIVIGIVRSGFFRGDGKILRFRLRITDHGRDVSFLRGESVGAIVTIFCEWFG
jgi:hypothetical protein